MDIWNLNSLALFIMFVIPGFISIKIYELIVPTCHRSSAHLVVDAIAYSCVNYAILAWPIVQLESTDIRITHLNWYAFSWMVILFIAPVMWAFFWKWLRIMEFFQKNMPHPTERPWDYVFFQRQSYWVKATLKNGMKVGGLYGENSFASK